MTEDELRALVRDSIARHVGPPVSGRPPARPRVPAHPSHIRLVLASGSDGDGVCLIEPAVTCTHCGYCQSYGH